MKQNLFFYAPLLLLVFGLMGCAHIHKVDGPVQKSEIPEGIQVGIGGLEVSEGEKVAVMKSFCKTVSRGRGGSVNQCSYKKIGEAKVLRVLDHDSAIVLPDDGLQMDNAMRVEKM